MKKALAIILLLCIPAMLAACGRNGSGNDVPALKHDYSKIDADTEGNIIIPLENISSVASFYNYDADGVTVQLLAIRDPGGKAHISYNTCKSCSPSPKAYFVQQGEVLICENCGNAFTPEQVGLSSSGCFPWPIEGAVIGEDSITVPAASLDAMRASFSTWKGPTE